MIRISELIEKLERIKEKEGDAFVYAEADGKFNRLDEYVVDEKLSKKDEKVVQLF